MLLNRCFARHAVAAAILLAVVLITAGADTRARAAAPAPVRGKISGLALSSHALATAVGQAVLDKGGNAVDAAVAVGYALAVVHPVAGNIGGGGFALVRMADGTAVMADFREKAPLAATPGMFLDAEGRVVPGASANGCLSAGTPGSVAGMSALLERFGTRKLPELMAPAIRLAEKGFVISARQEESLARATPRLAEHAASRAYFLKPGGVPYKEGERLVQKDLAATLRRIASRGPSGFYRGRTAALIVKAMQEGGGLITREDLASYSVVWREPVRGTYRGYEIISASPPSSGGALLVQMLNVMECSDIRATGFASSQTIRLMAEAMRQAFADRSEYMGDPDFVAVPVKKLIAKEYARAVHQRILAAGDKALPSSRVRPGLSWHEKDNTTHYSVADGRGNAVAVTYTLNDAYGSAVAVAGAGFLLNNIMDDFSVKAGSPDMYGLVGGAANAPDAQKRPLSAMTPTIALKDGRLFMVAGSPGGPRIITTVLQVISNVIDHGMNISEAVAAPRFHMQWQPDELRVERLGLVRDVEEKLEIMGYKVVVKAPMGDVNAILADPATGRLTGSGDPRAEF